MSISQTTAKMFADRVGRTNLAQRVGVELPAVSNAIKRGSFPSSWYEIGQSLADEVGIECPSSLFNQKSPHASRHVKSKASSQGSQSPDNSPQPLTGGGE